jgi:hypothetical protein
MYGTAPRIDQAQPGPLVLDPAAASRRTMYSMGRSTASNPPSHAAAGNEDAWRWTTHHNLAAQAREASLMQQAAAQQQMQMQAQYQRGMNSLPVADDMYHRAARDNVQGTLLMQQQMALLAQQNSAPQQQQLLQQMQMQQQMQQLQLKHMQQAGYGFAPAQTSALQSPTNIPGAYGQPSQPQQQAPQAFGQDAAARERQQQSGAGNANVNMNMYGNLMGNMGNDSSSQFSTFYTAALQIAQQQQHAAPAQQLAEGMLGSLQHTHLHAPQVHTPEQTRELLEGPMIQALMRAAAPTNVFKYNPDDHPLDNVQLWKGFGKSKVPPGSYVAPDGTLVAGEGSKIIINHGGKVTNVGAHVANLYGECTNIRGRTDNYFGTVHNAEGIVVNNGGRVHNLRGYVENLEGEVANYCGDVRNVRGDVQNEQGRVQNEGGRVLNHRGAVASLGGVIDNYYGDVACISSAVKNRQGVVHGYACEISNEMGLCNNEQGNCVNVGGLVENKDGFVQNYAGYVRNNSPATCTSTACGLGQGHLLYQSIQGSLSTFVGHASNESGSTEETSIALRALLSPRAASPIRNSGRLFLAGAGRCKREVQSVLTTSTALCACCHGETARN